MVNTSLKQSKIPTGYVQPGTGIFPWQGSSRKNVQLEYVCMGFDEFYNGSSSRITWRNLEKKLNDVKSRNHQVVLRLRDQAGSNEDSSTPHVPKYILDSDDFKNSDYPDWSSDLYKKFYMQFFGKFRKHYDGDQRIAFLQLGFGYWGEFHLSGGTYTPGETFPDKKFIARFVKYIEHYFKKTDCSFSIDSVQHGIDTSRKFGVFNDTFMDPSDKTKKYHTEMYDALKLDERVKRHSSGGEFSNNSNDLKPQLKEVKEYIRKLKITYAGANPQYRVTDDETIDLVSAEMGYSYTIDLSGSKIVVTNNGAAPLYVDAFVFVNDKQVGPSLKGEDVEIPFDGTVDKIEIKSDRFLPEQEIKFNLIV